MGKENRLRDKPVRYWVSQSEKEIIESKAAAAQLSVSEYNRRMVLDGVVIVYDTVSLSDCVSEINRIGQNINQIAKNCNVMGVVTMDDFKELQMQCDKLSGILISRAMGISTSKESMSDTIGYNEHKGD